MHVLLSGFRYALWFVIGPHGKNELDVRQFNDRNLTIFLIFPSLFLRVLLFFLAQLWCLLSEWCTGIASTICCKRYIYWFKFVTCSSATRNTKGWHWTDCDLLTTNRYWPVGPMYHVVHRAAVNKGKFSTSAYPIFAWCLLTSRSSKLDMRHL